MNDYWIAVILGIVEGLTEFLPVSSTAHIRIAQIGLGIDAENEYWKMFSVVIQLGAILAVVVYFWQRLLGLLKDFSKKIDRLRNDEASDTDTREQPTMDLWKHPLALVLIAFVVTAIPCFLIDKQIGELLERIDIMAWALIIGGVLMCLIDWYCSSRSVTNKLEDVTWQQAIWIGLTQILAAAFPGTSRSMATIAGGQVAGLSRATALEFSFFLSIPVMFAATGFKLLQFVLESESTLSGRDWSVLAIGFSVSFLVALAVIAWFMHWVRRQGFLPFALYRVAAGAFLLWWK